MRKILTFVRAAAAWAILLLLVSMASEFVLSYDPSLWHSLAWMGIAVAIVRTYLKTRVSTYRRGRDLTRHRVISDEEIQSRLFHGGRDA